MEAAELARRLTVADRARRQCGGPVARAGRVGGDVCAHAPADPASVRGMRATERTAAAEVAPAGTGTGAVAEEEVRALSAVAAGPPTHRGGAA